MSTTPTDSQPVEHTPGPWTIIPATGLAGVHPNHAYRFVGTADFDEETGAGHIVARLTDAVEIAANARLIAAAPDLLAACKAALAEIESPSRFGYRPEEMDLIRSLHAAITKAGGAQ